MKKKRQIAPHERRGILLFCLFVLAFSGLYLRIACITAAPDLKETAKAQSTYSLTLESRRGFIYDCNFLPLVNEEKEEATLVAPSASNLSAVLTAVSPSQREEIDALWTTGKPFVLPGVSLSGPGLCPFSRYQRYGAPQTAIHLIGYTSSEGEGIAGLEKSFNTLLTETGGETRAVCTLDGLGRSIPGCEPQIQGEGESGGGIVLSIDKNIQNVIEAVGKRFLKKGAIVVLDPYSGEIKASASFPAYTLQTLGTDVADEENTPMINRAFLPYAVGSTFKIVTAAAALEAGIPLSESMVCEGYLDVGGQIFRCHNLAGHGEVDLLDGMMESCNPYFIHLAQLTGGAALLKTARRFGFGEGLTLAPGIGVSGGSLPGEAEMQNPAAVANLSFGQGVLTASPVQIARMTAAVVNGGYLVTPKLLLGTTADGKTLSRESSIPDQQILSPDIAAQIQALLIHCVMVKEGQNALPSLTSAGGKTATAQTGRFDEEGNEYENGWFSGFFPAAAPRYVVTVLSEDGGAGNGSAASAFAAIADAITKLEE